MSFRSVNKKTRRITFLYGPYVLERTSFWYRSVSPQFLFVTVPKSQVPKICKSETVNFVNGGTDSRVEGVRTKGNGCIFPQSVN